MSVTVSRAAKSSDLETILAFLTEASLPTDGVEEHLSTFLVAEEHGSIVGAIGIEPYGATALLRSAVVRPDHRSQGIGGMLYQKLLGVAQAGGARRLLLLTTTAEGYFRKLGFRPIDIKTVTGPVTQSAEFHGACPGTAVCMELNL